MLFFFKLEFMMVRKTIRFEIITTTNRIATFAILTDSLYIFFIAVTNRDNAQHYCVKIIIIPSPLVKNIITYDTFMVSAETFRRKF